MGADYAAAPAAEAVGGSWEGEAAGDGGGMAMAEPPAMAADVGAAKEEAAPLRVADEDRDAGYDRNIQSGTLTAGTFDDTLNPEVLSAFMRGMAQNPSLALVAEHFAGPMTTISVVDDHGRPVNGARVEIRASQRQGRTLTTGTDGRAIAISGYDHASAQQLEARVDQGAWMSVAEGGKTTLRTQARATPIRALDVALVIDATGSMSDELEYLKVELRSIARELDQEFPQVDQRYSLVVYRDHGDDYVTRAFDFTADLKTFERQLGRQSAGGGGDYPEAMDDALRDATQLSWREGADTARVTFLIADAPPHTQDFQSTMTASEQLRSKGVAMYPIAASGVAEEAEMVMRAAAASTGGQYLFITDDSGVGNSHAEPHIPCYAVEHLRSAMARMLLSELAGKRVEADPRRAVRQVGTSNAGVCAPLNLAR